MAGDLAGAEALQADEGKQFERGLAGTFYARRLTCGERIETETDIERGTLSTEVGIELEGKADASDRSPNGGFDFDVAFDAAVHRIRDV